MKTSTPKSDTLGDIYTGTASFGRIMSKWSAIFFSVVGVLLIFLGIYLILKKNKITSSTSATVANCGVKTKAFIDSNGVIGKIATDCCTPVANNNNISYNCSVTVNYNVNGKPYSNSLKIPDAGTNWKTGDSIKIYYDPTNPNTMSYHSDNYHTMGVILIVVCVVVIALSWLQVYLTRHSKMFAGLVGAADGVHLIENIF